MKTEEPRILNLACVLLYCENLEYSNNLVYNTPKHRSGLTFCLYDLVGYYCSSKTETDYIREATAQLILRESNTIALMAEYALQFLIDTCVDKICSLGKEDGMPYVKKYQVTFKYILNVLPLADNVKHRYASLMTTSMKRVLS